MENEICRACDGYWGEEIFVQDLNESDHLEDPGVDGDNIKMGLKVNRRVWSGLIWLRIGTSGGCYGHGKENNFT